MVNFKIYGEGDILAGFQFIKLKFIEYIVNSGWFLGNLAIQP